MGGTQHRSQCPSLLRLLPGGWEQQQAEWCSKEFNDLFKYLLRPPGSPLVPPPCQAQVSAAAAAGAALQELQASEWMK